MKKTLIALSLLALCGSASAEVILYGKIRAGVEFNRGFDHEKSWGVKDFGSYIGFKGSENLGGGDLKAIWQVETRAPVNGNGLDGKRDTFIGFEGNFGRATLGHQATPLYRATERFNQWEASDTDSGFPMQLKYFRRYSGNRHTSLQYQSPEWGGFDFSLMVAPGSNLYNGSRTQDHNPAFGLGLNYQNSGFFAKYGLEYAMRGKDRHSGKDAHIHALIGGYDANNLYLALGLQYAKNVYPYFGGPSNVTRQVNTYINDVYGTATINIGGTNYDVPYNATLKEAAISAAYSFGAVTPKISLAYGTSSGSTLSNGATVGDGGRYMQAIVGADYAFSRRTTALATLGYIRSRVSKRNSYDNQWGIGTGLVHKF